MNFETNQKVYRRDHGTIVLYQRADHKNPRWQCRISVDGTDGYIIKSTGKVSEEDAYLVAMRLYEDAVNRQKQTGNAKAKTFEQVVKEFLVWCQQTKSQNSAKEFSQRLWRYPMSMWRGVLIHKVDSQELERYVNQRKSSGIQEQSIARDLVHLKGLLKYAYSEKLINKIPDFPRVSNKSSARPAFSNDEWLLLIDSLDAWCKLVTQNNRDRVYLKFWILILGHSGIRPGTEHASITWQSISHRIFAGQKHQTLVIQLKAAKTKARIVVPDPVCEGYFAALKKFRADELGHEPPITEPIFCHTNGKPIVSFKRGFAALLQWLDLTHDYTGAPRVPYSLRHTYATRKIAENVSLSYLAKNMGTSVVMLERHYVQPSVDDYGKAIANSSTYRPPIRRIE